MAFRFVVWITGLLRTTSGLAAKVFKEKISGAKTDRPELAKVISRLESGDVLVVTRLNK